nr:uncharacterized protein LOC109684981 isoform X5 [Castor canadensis]
MACRRMGPLRVAVGLLDGPEARQRHLDMAGEPRPGPTRPGQKRQQGTAIFWVYEYQRIPPLINQVPAKIRRTHVGLGIKSSCNPHKASRNSHLAPRQMKPVPTEELHSIRRALSQIKAQVDSLLESLEHMDQQDDQPEGQVSNRPRPHSKQAQLFLFLNLPEHQGSCLVLSLTTGLPYPEHTSPPLPLAVRLLWLLGCPITFAHLAPL